MKKRIISLILVAVMTVLALASCGFNYLSADMSEYATFDKAAYLKEIAKIVIEDGEFSDSDLEKREKMVIDAIYADLAEVADTSVKYVGKVDDPETDEDESQPKIGEHDLVYYYYYAVDKNGNQFFTDKMKSSTSKVQLGILAPAEDDVLTATLVEALKSFSFSEDTLYTPITSTEKIEAGMWVYVSFAREYETTDKDGKVTGTATETASNWRVQIPASYTEENKSEWEKTFLGQLIGQTVGSSTIKIDNTKLTDGSKYTNVKVTHAEKLGLTAIEVPGVVLYPKDDYTEKKENTTLYTGTDNKSVDLAGAELTYFVYPASYVTVPEYTVDSLMDEVYSGSKMTITNIAKILYGEKYTEAAAEEDATAALDALYKEYNEKFEKDGEKLGLKDFIVALSTAQTALDKAEDALEKAEDEFETAETALNDAIKAYNDAKKASEDANTAKKAAEDAYKAAQTATAEAKKVAANVTAYDAAKAEYDAAYANAEHKKALESAQKTVDTKTKAVTDAQKAYDAANEDEKAAKEEALDAAKEELKTAEAALAATVIKVKEAAWAATAIRAAELAEKAALDTKTAKTTDAETKEKTLSTKSAALSTAKTTYIVKRGNLDGTPDYILTPAEEGYEAKKTAYEAALAALLEANKGTDAEAKKTARAAFVAARVAFAVEPTADDDGKVPANPAETDPCPGDAKYKEKGAINANTKATEEKEHLYGQLIEVIGEKKLIEGYEYNVVYRELEDAYNKEIRTAVIEKIYNDIIKKTVSFEGKLAPQDEVDEVYEKMMDNYQYCFYKEYDVKNLLHDSTGASDTVEKDKTYFERFGGDFEKFMVELAVPTTIKGAAPKTYAEAKAMVRETATTVVNEKIRLFAVAEGLGVKVTEEQFDAFLEEKGFENIDDEQILKDLKATYQLKVLLDAILDSEETKNEETESRFAPTIVTYKGFELVKE